MTLAPALLAASAGVGFGHAILPDHWVPLAVVGRARRYPLSKVARLSGLAGIAHVLLSIVLGGLIIAIGLQFRGAIQSAQDTIIGCLLIATGLGFVVLELSGRGHSHDRADHGHTHDHRHYRHTATTINTTTTTTSAAGSADWQRSWSRSARQLPQTSRSCRCSSPPQRPVLRPRSDRW